MYTIDNNQDNHAKELNFFCACSNLKNNLVKLLFVEHELFLYYFNYQYFTSFKLLKYDHLELFIRYKKIPGSKVTSINNKI